MVQPSGPGRTWDQAAQVVSEWGRTMQIGSVGARCGLGAAGVAAVLQYLAKNAPNTCDSALESVTGLSPSCSRGYW